ncbi:tripartite tricarboxylate transporter substrate binding protein [Microbacteriaceae bacterium K1510]|nr:tripartite tricarboxylate transporter substrate binding protein [Microbacteriaceae bacterium K1510]
MKLDRRTFLLGTGSVLAASSAFAQSWPNRPIHLIVPYPAGGGTDYFARLVATPMSQTLGQQIVVENRPGAGTNLGAEQVARSQPDGYTFMLGDTATYAANKSLYAKLNFDAEKDFAPISLTGRFAVVLLVNTDKLKVNSVKELIDEAKKAPGKIDYASVGVGTPFHLAAELFAQSAGIKLNHVPYRGAAPAIQDLVGGQIGMMFIDFATARGQLTNKQIKAIAVASPGEFYGLPGVAPVSKDVPGYEAWAWQGFVLPAKTPAEIVAKFHDAYVKAVTDPEIKQKLIGAGIDPLQSTPAEMAAYMKSESDKWAKVIKSANIRIE